MIKFEKEILIKIKFNIWICIILITALKFLIKDKLYILDISISTIKKWGKKNNTEQKKKWKTLITVIKLRQS